MITDTTITTDLLTPLGAYLRLRGMGTASFLLESVERGRLGRASWMGAGSRLVTFEEARRLVRFPENLEELDALERHVRALPPRG